MTHQVLSRENQDLPHAIEVYEIGERRLYVKTGVRNFAISETDVTPEELIGIARDMASRQARLPGVSQREGCPVKSRITPGRQLKD